MGRGTGGGGAVGGNRTHDVWMMEPLEDLHFALHPLLVPLDLVLRNGLQRNIAHDVGRLGGVIMRGCVGGGRGDRDDGCGRGGCKRHKRARESSCNVHVHWAVDALPIHLLRGPSRLSIQHRSHGGLLGGTFDDVHTMFLA
jgi:hypothetical protein